MTMPDVQDARPLREHALDPAHVALLFTDFVSGDGVEYAHLLAVWREVIK